MNNSTFGKTMGNLRKRINVRQDNNVRDYKKYVSKPNFVSQKIFSKILAAIHEIKPVLTLGKPILDLSKYLMYEFHYKFIKKENIMQKMFMKIFVEIKICFLFVIINEIQSFLILPIKKLLVK